MLDEKETLNVEENNEPAKKRPRLSKKEKKKLRGQNKARPAPFKLKREKQLCNSLVNTAENEEPKKCTNEKCKFLHNVQEYLQMKPKDIGKYLLIT